MFLLMMRRWLMCNYDQACSVSFPSPMNWEWRTILLMAFSGFTWNNYAPLRPLSFHDATHNLISKALPDYGVLSQLSLHSYLTTLRISIGVSETCILLLSQRQDESTTACVRRKGLSERIKSFLWDLAHCVLSDQLYQIWEKALYAIYMYESIGGRHWHYCCWEDFDCEQGILDDWWC